MTPPRHAEKFGTIEPKSQWSATYRRIFNTFPQYDFVGHSDRRYDLPPGYDIYESSTNTKPRGDYAKITRPQSAPPTAPPPPPPHSPSHPPTVSTASLSPQSILRSHDSSPRSRKRVSICDVAYESRLPQELAIRRALNREDVEEFLVDLARKEFPGGGHVEVTSQPPRDACFDSLMKMSTEDKTIYVSLKHIFSVADSRDKLSNREGDCVPSQVSTKKPVTRLDSNATTTSYASTRTSLFEEMKAVRGLLKLDDKENEKPVLVGKEGDEETKNTLPHIVCNSIEKEPKNWTTSKTWNASKPHEQNSTHKEDFSRKPPNPSHPHLIAVVRGKVETGEILDWPDLFVLKTFHLATVQPVEEQLFRKVLADEDASVLEKDLDEEYNAYERVLEGVRVAPGAYTSLAHSICLADAFWFHARIISDLHRQQTFYRKAINEYSNLMQRAEKTLPPDNLSLLHVAEKTATLLAESENFDPDLVMRTALLVDRAERALEERPEATARKRTKRLKARLAEINRHCHVLV